MNGDRRTQVQRLLDYLEANQSGITTLEITSRLGIVNVTGRISDLRARGHRVEDRRDHRGVHRYYLVREGQLELALA